MKKDSTKRAKCICDSWHKHSACELCHPNRSDKRRIKKTMRQKAKKLLYKLLNY